MANSATWIDSSSALSNGKTVNDKDQEPWNRHSNTLSIYKIQETINA